MVNILASLLSGLTGVGTPTETEVDEIVVTPKKKPALAPPPPAQSPYTDDYLVAVEQAELAKKKLPRVSGATDAGLFGMLPENIRNSRFRDVLGAIGDGLLIGSKADPIYGPRRDQRAMGQALIGYGQNPQAAIERLAQTGAPKSVELAQDYQTNVDANEIKRQNAEYLNEYRQGQLKQKNEALFTNIGRYVVPGLLARAKTPELYASAYERLTDIARRTDPDADATTAFGIPHPDDWTPEMTEWIGTTGGQQIRADTTREGIAQRRESAGWAHQDRQSSISQRERASLRSDANSDADRAQRASSKSKPKAGSKTPPVVRNRDVTLLKEVIKKDPSARKQFDARFGPGAAKKYLGY